MTKIILIAGGSGLIGRSLIKHLTDQHFELRILSRREISIPGTKVFKWNPEKLQIDPQALENVNIIINLSGENIAGWFWTNSRKEKLLQSRLQSIALLESTLARLNHRPGIIIQSSAIGIYGHRDNEQVNESNTVQPNDFASHLVHQWEQSALRLQDCCDRLVIIRTANVLSNEGGYWPKMTLTKFLRTLVWFGDGQQSVSWIHIKDYNRIIDFILSTASVRGIVNVCSPQPVQGKFFVQTAIAQLGGPFINFGLPTWFIRLVFGELSDLLLSSIKVYPKVLLESHFNFIFPDLPSAIQDLTKGKP